MLPEKGSVMETQMTAIETTGTVDEQRELRLDHPLPIPGPARVRVIVFYPPKDEPWNESEWLRTAARNPAFDFLKDAKEDIYTLADGKPFVD